jgi:hypothetical protein
MSEKLKTMSGHLPDDAFNNLAGKDLLNKIGDFTTPIGVVPVATAFKAVHGSATFGNTVREIVREAKWDENWDMEDYFHEDSDVPIDDDPYQSLARLGIDLTEGQALSADIGALIGTTMSAVGKINTLPTIANKLKNGAWLTRGLTNMGVGVGASGVTSALVSDTTEGSVFEFIPEEHRPMALEWFMDKDEDTELDRRFKNFVEDSLVGMSADAIFTFMSGANQLRKTINTRKTRAEALDMANEMLDGGKGHVVREYVDERSMASMVAPDMALNVTGTQMLKTFEEAKNGIGEIARLKQQMHNAPLQRQRDKLAKKIERAENLIKGDIRRAYADMPVTGMEELSYLSDIGPQMVKETTEVLTEAQKGAKSASIKKSYIKTRKAIKEGSERLYREVDDFKKVVNDNPLLQDDEGAKELLRRFKDHEGWGTQTRNSTKMSSTGDESVEGLVSVLEQLAKAEGFKKSTVSVTEQFTNITKTLREAPDSSLAKAFRRFMDDQGISEAKLVATMSQSDVNIESLPVMIMAMNKFRDESKWALHSMSKKLNDMEELDTKLLAKFLSEGQRFDTLDSVIASKLSPTARSLRAQGRSGRDNVGQLMDDMLRDLDPKNVKESKVNDIFTKTLDELSPDEMLELKGVISKVARSNPKDWKVGKLGQVLTTTRFGDLIMANAVGGMIGSISTAGKVFAGTAAMSLFKNIIMKNFEALLNVPMRAIGRDQGHRVFTENMERLAGVLDVSGDYLKLLFGKSEGLNAKAFGLDSADYTNNLTHATPSEIFDRVNEAIKATGDEGRRMAEYTQKAMKMPLGLSLVANNYGVRTLENLDNMFRRFGIQMEARTLANRMWIREGGQKLFNESMTRHQFVDRVAEISNGYLWAKQQVENGVMSEEAMSRLTAKLFGEDKALMTQIDNIASKSNIDALETTLQETTKDNILGKGMSSLSHMSADSMAGRFALTSVFPFKKTIINYGRSAMEHSPFAPMSKRWRDRLMSGDPNERMKAIASITFGTGALLSGAGLALEGRLTGSLNHESWVETHGRGAQPHSILVGDTWWDYSVIAGPLAPALSATADYMNMESDTDEDQEMHYDRLLGLYMQNLLMDSHAGILHELLEAINDKKPVEAFSKLAFDKGTMFTKPFQSVATTANMVFGSENKFESVIDKETAEGYEWFKMNLVNSYKNYIPEESKLIGQKVNVFGAPSKRHGKGTMNYLLGALGQKNGSPDLSRAVSNMTRLEMMSSSDSLKDLYGIQMTGEQFKNYKKNMWQGTDGLMNEMEQVVTAPSWLLMNDNEQRRKLTRMIDKRSKLIKRMMKLGDESIQEAVEVKQLTDFVNRDDSTASKSDLTAMEEYIHSNSNKLKKDALKLNKALGQ